MQLTIICRGKRTSPVTFGMERLERAAAGKGIEVYYDTYWNGEGIYLLAGVVGERFVQITLARAGIYMEYRPEGVVITAAVTDDGRQLTVVSGTDDTGLMYALCELAERIEDQGMAAILEPERTVEYPAIPNRIVGRFLQSSRDDDWYFSDGFWDYYTARLAENRINRLHLITGMDTAYMSPPYPFLVKTPGYEEVYAITEENPEQRRENCLDQLRKIGQKCHDRGIAFCFGCWQQKPWTANQKTLVQNCPDGACFIDYAKKSIKELIMQCPEIDILSFRVNPEAGVRDMSGTFNTDQGFWYEMLRAVSEAGRKVKIELRAKGLTDSMTKYALSLGLDVTIPTKAWCEHIGLPYQMLQMRREEMDKKANENSWRRYSYDNMQIKPRNYDLQYRLWNYGSTNILLWGDPDYVSRFIPSCVAGQATGFEFTAPLSMKGGHAMIPGESWPVHVHPDMITYRYEDERYWMWYLSYGRLSYNPEGTPELWRRHMRARFGEYAADMEQAYLASGKLLPLITAAHFPEHPSMHYWPELYGSAALFAENNYEPWFTQEGNPWKKGKWYGNADPSDEALFCSMEAWIEGQLSGKPLHCYSPLEIGDWYYKLASQTKDAVDRLKKGEINREIKASRVDFAMLADLGFYHAYMVQAAYHLCMFYKTNGRDCLLPAYEAMYSAWKAFGRLSMLGTRYYAANLEFDAGDSVRRNGNWEDRMIYQVDKDLKKMMELLDENGVAYRIPGEEAYHSLTKPTTDHIYFTDNVPPRWETGKNLTVTLKADYGQLYKADLMPVMHYRNVNMREETFRSIKMQPDGDGFKAVVPGEYISSAYNLYIYFTAEEPDGKIYIHPGIYHPLYRLPVHIVETE